MHSVVMTCSTEQPSKGVVQRAAGGGGGGGGKRRQPSHPQHGLQLHRSHVLWAASGHRRRTTRGPALSGLGGGTAIQALTVCTVAAPAAGSIASSVARAPSSSAGWCQDARLAAILAAPQKLPHTLSMRSGRRETRSQLQEGERAQRRAREGAAA